jgi:hypothetical protein
MPEPIPNSYQEILEYLAKKSEEPEHGDCFKLKVLRRPNASSQIRSTWPRSQTPRSRWSRTANPGSPRSRVAGLRPHVFDGKGKRQHAVLTPRRSSERPHPGSPRHEVEHLAWPT